MRKHRRLEAGFTRYTLDAAWKSSIERTDGGRKELGRLGWDFVVMPFEALLAGFAQMDLTRPILIRRHHLEIICATVDFH